jgi:hypothetical protein
MTTRAWQRAAATGLTLRTTARIHTHCRLPQQSARAEPVCAATSSGCSGGPVPLVCAAGWLGLASGEPASHRIADEGYKCANKSAAGSCEAECSARTHGVDVCTRTGASTKGVYMTHLPGALQCRRAAVCSCRPPLRPSAAVVPVHLPWDTRCTHSGVLHRLTYWEYSHVLPKGTVSTRTCGMRRCADVISRLDRRRLRLRRRTCGGVLGVLTVGYSEYSQLGTRSTHKGRAAHTAGAHECRRSGHMLQNQEKKSKMPRNDTS